MKAVTGLRRTRIFAIAALLAAGCGANPPSATPSATARTNDTAAPTSPVATPAPTVLAPTASDSGCPTLTPDTWTPSADFRLETPIGGDFLGLDVTRVTSNRNPAESAEFEAREPYLEEPGRLVGKWEIGVRPDIDYDEPIDVPITLIAANAELRIGGRDPVPMGGRVAADGHAFLFDMPNVNGSVVIEYNVEWSDACFVYRAEGAGAYEMVRAADAARCPTSHKSFATHWAELNQPPVRVAGVAVQLSRTSTSGKWTPYAVSAQGIVGYAQWDPAMATVVGPARGTVRVGDGNADLDLLFLATDFYRREDIVDYFDPEGRPGRTRVVFHSRAEPYADGHFELLLPPDPGHFVASFYFFYETPCASGDGVGAVAIDVE
jgi:hypothetical protein